MIKMTDNKQLNAMYASFDWQIYKAFVEGHKEELKKHGINADFISKFADEKAKIGMSTLDEIVLFEQSKGNLEQIKNQVKSKGKEKEYEKDFKELQQLLDLYTKKESKNIAQKLYDEVPKKLEMALRANGDEKSIPSKTIDTIYKQIFKTAEESAQYAQLEVLSAAISMYMTKITQRLANDGIIPKDKVPKEIMNLKDKDFQDFIGVYAQFKQAQLESRYGKSQDLKKAA